jgi:SAM-dependent methyltransferase
MPYQTFTDVSGDSDSAAKLRRLHLPDDLSGRSFLDIACNEGFFCQEAWRRGANRVVGIDRNPEFIERASQRNSGTEYLTMDWSNLSSLGETFDVILLLSALHYAAEPERLLRDVLDLLRPNGLFVLECGVAPGPRAEWVRVERPVGDVVSHPTHVMLARSLQKRAAVRRIGPSVDQPGDPVERHVYHVRWLKPMVLLVSGPSYSGKTTLMDALSFEGSMPVHLDHLFIDIPSWCRDESLLALWKTQSFSAERINELVDFVVNEGIEETFVDQVISTLPAFFQDRGSGVIVIEGYALSQGNFRAAFTTRLRARGYYVWHVEPAAAPVREIPGAE